MRNLAKNRKIYIKNEIYIPFMLDNKDLAIIEVLKHNSNFSTQQISKKTGIPISTVHNRIRKLEKSGIIKEYTILLDNKKIGKPIAASI